MLSYTWARVGILLMCNTVIKYKLHESEDINTIIKGVFSNFAPHFNDQGFVRDLTGGVMENLETIDIYITKYATEWPLEQITIVDRNILRIGVYELVFNDDIPAKVAINEAIEIFSKDPKNLVRIFG